MRRRFALGTVTTALLAPLALAACGPAAGHQAKGIASSARPVASASSAAPSGSPPGPSSSPAAGTGRQGFSAASVTWVSADEGFVLGAAPCARGRCTSILRTADRGATWSGLHAPSETLSTYQAGPGVWGIRFASPSHGFVFGRGLWETTDGGGHWTRAPHGPGDGSAIFSLEVSDGEVLAVAAGRLYRRPLAGGSWTRLGAADSMVPIGTGYGSAAVLNGSRVLATSDGGRSLASHATPCTNLESNGAVAVAVTGPGSLALLCAGDGTGGGTAKTVYISSDLGATWSRAGTPGTGGDARDIAGGTSSRLVVEANGGASVLYDSLTAGKTWGTAYERGDGELGFNDLGFTNASDGSVISAPAWEDVVDREHGGQLLLTGDGGATWHAVTW